ncbi:MAG: hypothetical protein RL217_939 [Pseudomonadota bacterium]|jgi:soluble lytic murein transglycosylase-like protein
MLSLALRATGLSLVLSLLLCFSLPSWAAATAVDPELREALKIAVNNNDSFDDKYEAEVWLLDVSTRLKRWMPDDKKRVEFLRILHSEAARAGVQPELVLAVIQIESAFERFAISSVGAQGYMQVMPFWKKEIGRPSDNLMHEQTNLRYGCTILRHYLNKEKDDFIRALARYNGSLGRTKYPEKVLLAWERHWFVQY